MRFTSGVFAVMAGYASFVFAAAESTCSLKPVVSLPMYPTENGRFAVPISLNGQEFRFAIDTGAHRHTMASSVADALSASRVKISGKSETMVGGEPLNEYVTINDLALGPLKTPKMAMYILPDERIHDVDGLLASDLWSHYDVELDYAAGRIQLFEPCPGRATHWTQNDHPVTIAFSVNDNNHIIIAGKLADKPVDIRLDTGATETVADISRMSYFGLSPSTEGVRDMGKGVWYRYTFSQLNIGPLSLPDSRVAFVSGLRQQVFVGSDVLRRHHVLISYGDRTVTLIKASEDPAASNALEAFNQAYFAVEDHQWEKVRDFYAQALASPALPASYKAAAYYGRSQANYRLKQCAAAVSDLKAAIALDSHIADPRRPQPNPYIRAVQKNCPDQPQGLAN